MWNQIACKPKLKVKQQLSEMKKHSKALGEAKATVDVKAPLVLQHLQINKKKQQQEQGST